MQFINSIAGVVGISGTALIIIVVLLVVLGAVWAAIRAALRIAIHIFATGCLVILGVLVALYIVFAVLKL